MVLSNPPRNHAAERVADEYGGSTEFAQHSNNITAVVCKTVVPWRVGGAAVPSKGEPHNATTLRDILRTPFPGVPAGCNAVKEYNRSGIGWAVNLDVQCG